MSDLRKERRKYLNIKIIAIGPIGCGKTSIIRRYTHGHFLGSYKATIGVDFQQKEGKLPKTHTVVGLSFWDLAGDERFGSMTSVYYRNAMGALIVFDVTRDKTIDNALRWYQDLLDRFESYESLPSIVFVANKIDMGQRVEYTDIENLMNKEKSQGRNKIIGLIETSAKDDIGIQETVNTILESIEAEMDVNELDRQDLDPLVLNNNCCA